MLVVIKQGLIQWFNLCCDQQIMNRMRRVPTKASLMVYIYIPKSPQDGKVQNAVNFKLGDWLHDVKPWLYKQKNDEGDRKLTIKIFGFTIACRMQRAECRTPLFQDNWESTSKSVTAREDSDSLNLQTLYVQSPARLQKRCIHVFSYEQHQEDPASSK